MNNNLLMILGLGLVPVLSAYAGGPTIPDSVRPGAIRPGEERQVKPPQPAPEVFAVPRVVDRPLDVDAGNKVVVSQFKLVGAVDRPQQKIKVADVQALVDKKRAERPQGFTVGRLQEVATAVTQYYRGKGLILAQAFIPVQDVQGGVVNIQIMEGTLGRVVMEGNKKYSTDVLSKPFEDLIGKPVTKEAVESALLHLTDYPGLGLFGVFQPGQLVGTADMVVKVQNEKRFDATLRADNHGLRETGVKRYRADLALNNPTNSADKLSWVGQITQSPNNLVFWGADYERPVFGPENKISGGYNRSAFAVGGTFAKQDIVGISQNAHMAVERSFIRSRQLNLSATVGLEHKESITHVKTRIQGDDKLSVLTGSLNFDNVDTRFAGLNSMKLEVSHGFDNFLGAMGDSDAAKALPSSQRPSRRGQSGNFASGEFNKVNFSATRLQSMAAFGKLFGKAEWFKGQSLLLRGEAQWSPDLLVPLEQYAIGGPNNVRAYQPTEALFDKAMFLSAEYTINAPGISDKPAFGGKTWGELLQFSIFYDVAFGELNDPLRSETPSRNYNGAGLAVSFNNPSKFATKFIFAEPIGGPLPANRRFPQFWLDMEYTY